MVLLALLCPLLALAATTDSWRARSVYQIITDRFARSDPADLTPCDPLKKEYCGGTWKGIHDHLDYIQGMGFSAIWISPIVENIPHNTSQGYAYHGYWTKDLYSLNSHFGSRDDLVSLQKALAKRDMYLMVDVVVNHVGSAQVAKDFTGEDITPFSKMSDYHPLCYIYNWSNQTQVEQCWVSEQTPDVDTESDFVINIYNNWIGDLVKNYSIDGLRIDTVKHVRQSFWPKFVQSSGVFAIGEVLADTTNYTCAYQNYMPSVFNYALYYRLQRAFLSPAGSISDLATMLKNNTRDCKDTLLLGNFIENADQPRYPANTSDPSQIANAFTYTLFADGIPFFYYGQEQNFTGASDPSNREPLWTSNYSTTSPSYIEIAKLNSFRNHIIAQSYDFVTSHMSLIYQDNNTLALFKDSLLFILTNLGQHGPQYTLALSKSGFPSGTQITEVDGCTQLTAGTNGALDVKMETGRPRILYPTNLLNGSGLCGHSNNTGNDTDRSAGIRLTPLDFWSFWQGSFFLVVLLFGI
ncbi:Alpha-amylase A type-1/2 [Neolecta irregularis DAH-3]|uniref:alpha-amylase n=1 Tax=Neolecta irregularis (strain DAH-3) TaxID=1198029 RepID=A0A1U7LLU4_NEOID|nr:Alpha-amylase A type-1/2 [Neolecta irregularis DAH-3]|eukprot:OLL23553.1 Alpha-amylase A type-1/2 [Neolecta irregularis DAH-3]